MIINQIMFNNFIIRNSDTVFGYLVDNFAFLFICATMFERLNDDLSLNLFQKVGA